MKVVITPEAANDLRRLHAFLDEKNPVAADRAVDDILDALHMLSGNPRAGFPCPEEPDARELIIPSGKSGYVVLYREDQRTLVVLAIRHQSEAGYPPPL